MIQQMGEAAKISATCALYQAINLGIARIPPSHKYTLLLAKAGAEIGYLVSASLALIEAIARSVLLLVLLPAMVTEKGREFYKRMAESAAYNFLLVAHTGAAACFYNFKDSYIDTDQISKEIFPCFQKRNINPLPRTLVEDSLFLVNFKPEEPSEESESDDEEEVKPKSGIYAMVSYPSRIAAQGNDLHVNNIETEYLVITYDRYAFDIRDVVDMVVNITEGENINPHKDPSSKDRRLWGLQGEGGATLELLIQKEKEILHTDHISTAVRNYRRGQRMQRLRTLKKMLQPQTLQTCKELGYVLKNEYYTKRQDVDQSPIAESRQAWQQFLDRGNFGETFDNKLVRGFALSELNEFITNLPQEERQSLRTHATIDRFLAGGDDVPLGYALDSALTGTFCMEHIGTGLSLLCEALQQMDPEHLQDPSISSAIQ